jgi:hypothetical protein
MSVWFEGENEIACTIQQVKDGFEDVGEHFLAVVSLFPGLTNVELVTHAPDSVTIKTNEGIMTRTNISKRVEADSVVIEFDEKYEAGTKVTATSHFVDEFSTSGAGVKHHLVMTDVAAPGFLGFFYRAFGGSKTGNAFLKAYKEYFESPAGS